MDALFFGSSPTFRALDTDLAEQAFNVVREERPSFFAFATGWGNPGLVYSHFRDYLANNPAPKVALIEVMNLKDMGISPRYVHPYTADLAPMYIYFDVLNSWSFVRHKIFALSDFLRLFVRHIDLSLGKLLVADYNFSVPEGDNCGAGNVIAHSDASKADANISFESMLASEVKKVTPDIPSNEVGTVVSLLRTYEEDEIMLELIQRRGIANRKLWSSHDTRERSLDYYRRMVELGTEHGVKIGFYVLPTILMREANENQVRQLEKELGAPLFLLPAPYAKVSYHHYMDRVHVTADFRPAYSVWFASLFDRLAIR